MNIEGYNSRISYSNCRFHCLGYVPNNETLVPTADFSEIKKRRGGKLRYQIYIKRVLELN